MNYYGIYTPLVTPLAGQDVLDVAALKRVIEHVIGGGVQGIFLLGTTGEGPLLTQRLQRQVIERAAEVIANRVPVLVNVTGASFTENIELASVAARAGAQAAVYSGPLYAPLNQEELAGHVERFAARCPLPLFLYNMPSHTHLFFEVETVERLAKTGRVVGLKDSSGDLMYMQRLCRAMGSGFPVFVGPEEMLYPALLAGVAGGVNGGSNLFPHIFVGIYDASRRGDAPEAERLQRLALDLSAAVYSRGYLPGLKAAMAALGLCSAVMAEPLVAFGQEDAKSIALALQRPEFRVPVAAGA